MKYSYQWLKELSGTTQAPEALADVLTVRAFEVEEVVAQDAGLAQVVVGAVTAVEAHPDADRLRVARVDVGEDAPRQIVCGAPNLAQGQKVPVALPGAVLPTPDGKGLKIRKGKIRGVVSDGMICAEDELGLGDDHEGIMVLDAAALVGVPLAHFLGREDTMLEIDILPNRAHDALSHEGVAREICAIEERSFAPRAVAQDVVQAIEAAPRDGVTVDVATPHCTRYTATVVDGVDNTVATPAWMRARLTTCGLRPINPIVDITNYVMLETGQPLHAFDAAQLTAKGDAAVHITVRQARADETLTLLDDTEIALSDADMVIADAAQPLALAGVMGGADSGVTADTTRVVLECAAFDAATIRAMRMRHNLTSDAAFRFERDPDPQLVARARARAVELMREIVGGRVMAAAEVYPAPVTPQTVRVAQTYVTRLLGTEIAPEVCVAILERLGIAVERDGDDLVCTIPTVRRDLTTPEDLIEEIGRLYGYERIVPQPLPAMVVAPPENAHRAFEHRTRDILVDGGFDEVRSYAFYSATDAQMCGLDARAHVALTNPMSAEHTLLRRTMVPALLRAVAKNLTHSADVRIFEVGRVYIPRNGDLPQERRVVALAVASKATDGVQFYAAKGMVDAYVRTLGIAAPIYTDAVADDAVAARLHPTRRALVRIGEETVGFIGEAPQKMARHYGIKNARVVVAQVDLALIENAVTTERIFTPLSKYPTVERDLSLRVGARTRVADVERVLAIAGGALLRDIDLFDLYVNDRTGERSMAFRCTFGAPDRTLTGAEVDEAIAAMIAAVEKDAEITVKQ